LVFVVVWLLFSLVVVVFGGTGGGIGGGRGVVEVKSVV
jgi:hypothetical protein